jgi:hypothetical protein
MFSEGFVRGANRLPILAIQEDPWGRPTGDVYCENCAEKHWYRQQERLMEET